MSSATNAASRATPYALSLPSIALFGLMVLLLSFDSLYALLQQGLDEARPVIRAHPVGGAVLFVLLSAASAWLAFFSSALLVPVAVYSWGRTVTIVLLWLGWMLGGVCAYGMGRVFGRPLVHGLGSARLSDFYLERLPARDRRSRC